MCLPDGAVLKREMVPIAEVTEAAGVISKRRRSLGEGMDQSIPPFGETVLFFLVALPGTLWFSLEFPHMLSQKAAMYYIPAGYKYDDDETKFDNSVWTYATDYLVTVFMVYGAVTMYGLKNLFASERGKYRHFEHLESLSLATSGLLALYGISVLIGGLSHQHFTSVSSLNTVQFRIMWTIVVGTVAGAGGVIGYIGTSLGRYFHDKNHIRYHIPLLPGWFWLHWGLGMSAVVVVGGMSFYRPACDIFIAGTTQFFATAYTVIMLLTRCFGKQADTNKFDETTKNGEKGGKNELSYGVVDFSSVKWSTRLMFIIAFFGNAPLLPLYPELLWSGLKLGVVNTILHCWLCVTWGMQFLSLKQIAESQRGAMR